MATAGRIEWPRLEPEPELGNAWGASPIRQTVSRDVPAMCRMMSQRCLASPRPLFLTLGKRNLYARAHRPQMQSGCVSRYDSRQATFRGVK